MMRRLERVQQGKGIFRPGQDLVAAGSIGKAGALKALEYKRAELSSRFSSTFMDRIEEKAKESLELFPETLLALGATEWEPVEEGGILTALWKLSGGYGQGISFDLRKIPVSQEIIEVCELLDLNPYRLASGECMIFAADNGADAVRALEEMGILAAVIGKVEKGIARKITGGGGTGYLERPQPDEAYKITGA